MERKSREYFEDKYRNKLLSKHLQNIRAELRKKEKLKARKKRLEAQEAGVKNTYKMKKIAISPERKQKAIDAINAFSKKEYFNNYIDKMYSEYLKNTKAGYNKVEEISSAYNAAKQEDRDISVRNFSFNLKGQYFLDCIYKTKAEYADLYLKSIGKGKDGIKEVDEKNERAEAMDAANEYLKTKVGQEELRKEVAKKLEEKQKDLINQREQYSKFVLTEFEKRYGKESYDGFIESLDNSLNAESSKGLLNIVRETMDLYVEKEIEYPESLPAENQIIEMIKSGDNPYENNYQMYKDVQEFFTAIEYDVVENNHKYSKKMSRELFNEETIARNEILSESLNEAFKDISVKQQIDDAEQFIYFDDYSEKDIDIASFGSKMKNVAGNAWGATKTVAGVSRDSVKFLYSLFVKPKKPVNYAKECAKLKQSEKYKECYAKWKEYYKYNWDLQTSEYVPTKSLIIEEAPVVVEEIKEEVPAVAKEVEEASVVTEEEMSTVVEENEEDEKNEDAVFKRLEDRIKGDLDIRFEGIIEFISENENDYSQEILEEIEKIKEEVQIVIAKDIDRNIKKIENAKVSKEVEEVIYAKIKRTITSKINKQTRKKGVESSYDRKKKTYTGRKPSLTKKELEQQNEKMQEEIGFYKRKYSKITMEVSKKTGLNIDDPKFIEFCEEVFECTKNGKISKDDMEKLKNHDFLNSEEINEERKEKIIDLTKEVGEETKDLRQDETDVKLADEEKQEDSVENIEKENDSQEQIEVENKNKVEDEKALWEASVEDILRDSMQEGSEINGDLVTILSSVVRKNEELSEDALKCLNEEHGLTEEQLRKLKKLQQLANNAFEDSQEK